MDYPEIVKSIELDPEEAKRMFGGRSPTSLKICTVVGDSMLGTIFPGSCRYRRYGKPVDR